MIRKPPRDFGRQWDKAASPSAPDHDTPLFDKGGLPNSRRFSRAASPSALDVERTVNEAAHHVIERWMREKMLRFSTYDDGSDDLILAAEIARHAAARLSRSAGEQDPGWDMSGREPTGL